MDDVDRIEVVRGPGGTLWGANAVNGVVNIITKPAGETQGGLITAGGGTEERIFSGARLRLQGRGQRRRPSLRQILPARRCPGRA